MSLLLKHFSTLPKPSAMLFSPGLTLRTALRIRVRCSRSWRTADLTRKQSASRCAFLRKGRRCFGPGCAVMPCCSMRRCPLLLTHLGNNAARERVHVVWYRPCCFVPFLHSQPVGQLLFPPVVFRFVGPPLFSLPK